MVEFVEYVILSLSVCRFLVEGVYIIDRLWILLLLLLGNSILL